MAKKNPCILRYFSRIKIWIGVPEKSQFSRILFSRKRLYGSFTHCGKLQKNTNEGMLPAGNWVIYLILMYLPFHAGGG